MLRYIMLNVLVAAAACCYIYKLIAACRNGELFITCDGTANLTLIKQ